MPVKNFLTQEQRANLQKALKQSEDSHFRQRSLTIDLLFNHWILIWLYSLKVYIYLLLLYNLNEIV